MNKIKYSVGTEQQLSDIQSLLPDFYYITFNQPGLAMELGYSVKPEVPKLFERNLHATDNIYNGSRD